jgi:hypothetical protein
LAHASASAAAVRQTDVRELARALGVRHVLICASAPQQCQRRDRSPARNGRQRDSDLGARLQLQRDTDWAWQRDIVCRWPARSTRVCPEILRRRRSRMARSWTQSTPYARALPGAPRQVTVRPARGSPSLREGARDRIRVGQCMGRHCP